VRLFCVGRLTGENRPPEVLKRRAKRSGIGDPVRDLDELHLSVPVLEDRIHGSEERALAMFSRDGLPRRVHEREVPADAGDMVMAGVVRGLPYPSRAAPLGSVRVRG